MVRKNEGRLDTILLCSVITGMFALGALPIGALGGWIKFDRETYLEPNTNQSAPQVKYDSEVNSSIERPSRQYTENN